jgi:hypothetical protein
MTPEGFAASDGRSSPTAVVGSTRSRFHSTRCGVKRHAGTRSLRSEDNATKAQVAVRRSSTGAAERALVRRRMTHNRIKTVVINDPPTDRQWDPFQEWLDDPLD